MTSDGYITQLRRLKDTYGDKNYPRERDALLFREVSRFTDDVFSRAVDKLISEEKFAPLLPKILEAMNKVIQSDREQMNRTMQPLDLSDAVKLSYNPEFAKLCNQVIQDKISGKLSKAQFEEALKYIDVYVETSGSHRNGR